MDIEAETTLHVRGARAGDPSSLEWLIARFTPALLMQARYRVERHLQQHVDPEDLVQDTWVIALPKLAQIQPREGRLTPALVRYLSQVLLHRYGTLLQKHILGKPIREALPELEGSAFATDPLAALPSEQTSVVVRAMRNEAMDRVHAALDRLTREDREVIVLRSLEQISLRTAAELLGSSENAVGVRHHRAIRRLRELLPDSGLEFPEDV